MSYLHRFTMLLLHQYIMCYNRGKCTYNRWNYGRIVINMTDSRVNFKVYVILSTFTDLCRLNLKLMLSKKTST